ncbi:MAG: cation transporter [Clostridia bacterium]|nr:cation transporter [Clostridia bacterium]
MREEKAKKATVVSVIVNVLLTLSKIIVGILGRSGAMLADGIHSLSDLVTDIIVFISIRISSKPADDDHNYGHGKFETMATFIVSIALFLAGFNILSNGVTNIFHFIKGAILVKPSSLVLYIALASIISKELLFRYTMMVGKKITSDAVIANAYHHRSDVLSSIGVLVSAVIIAIFGEKYAYFDSIAEIVVSAFIFNVAVKLLKPSLNQLTDSSMSDENTNAVKKVFDNHPSVFSYHHLRTRKIGNQYAIDIHALVNEKLNVIEAHDITVELETTLKEMLGNDTFISIHVEPYHQ